jgi:hypothetical protein
VIRETLRAKYSKPEPRTGRSRSHLASLSRTTR